MSKNVTVQSSGGIGFAGLLAIVFITLKLIGVITWSWLWVLSPLWIGLAIVFGFIAIVGLIGGVVLLGAVIIDFINKKKK